MPITYLAEIKSVANMRARVYLVSQVIHKEVQEEGVDIGVQHSDPLAE